MLRQVHGDEELFVLRGLYLHLRFSIKNLEWRSKKLINFLRNISYHLGDSFLFVIQAREIPVFLGLLGVQKTRPFQGYLVSEINLIIYV